MGAMEARRRILLNQPHLIDASGNPISFSTDMAAKMGVKAHFAPMQEGTGDPSPSNVRPISGWTGCNVTRCGKNLCSAAIERGSINSVTGGEINDVTNRVRTSGYLWLKKGTYTISAVGVGQGIFFVFDEEKTYLKNESNAGFVNLPRTVTLSSDRYVRFAFRVSSNNENVSPSDVSNVMLNSGSSVQTYEPYSGSSYPVTFPAVGKNLFDEAYTDISTSIKYKPIYVGDSAVTLSTDNPEVLQGVANLFLLAGDVSYGASSVTNGVWANNPKTVTPVGGYVTIAYRAYSGTISPTQSQTQLEKGQTPTTYEPFTNTLYGGYVDYEKGEVVAEWFIYNVLWSNKSGSEALTNVERRLFNLPEGITPKSTSYYNTNKSDTMCNVAAWKWDYSHDSTHYYIALSGNTYKGIVFLPIGTSEDTQIQVGGKLETPIHYPITPQLIKTLRGANTIWSDANGNIQIKYWKH